MRLFVYGTLKSGDCRAYLLAGRPKLGAARTAAGYRLLDCGAYPAMIESDGGGHVEGEVYDVDDALWPRLDAEEGVEAGLYRRAAVRLDEPPGAGPCVTYLFTRPAEGLPDLGGVWWPRR